MPIRDPLKYFRVEARELWESLQRGILDLEKGALSKDAVTALLRCAHTLKGASRVVKQLAIAELAHKLEEELEPLREGATALPIGLLGRLFVLVDDLGDKLQGLGAPREPQALVDQRRIESVRLEVAELDSVMEGLREIGSRLTQLRQKGQLDALSLQVLDQASRELESVHGRAGRMRLLPASTLFSFLERACRDAAEATGKAVLFEAQGGEQRLDAPVLLALQEALQHAVRNSVVHGIEDAQERSRSGKVMIAMVRVELTLASGRAIFRCVDDGRGLDLAAVALAAAARGWIPAGTALSEEEALALLLRGGLSTSKELTELAGRGLGLDVLRETATRLKGRLQLSNHPGKGLELRIDVPASLSAYPVLEVEASGRRVLVPFSAVRSVQRLEAETLSRLADGEVVLVNGEAVPLMPLDACYGVRAQRSRVAVLLDSGSGPAALGVERILGVREAVVLPFPEMAPPSEWALGACLDAAGDPCLVLDPDCLVRAARERRVPDPGQAPIERLPLLVVDDSLTTRMLEQSILETAGYEVDLADSGEEGLARLRQRRYGLLLVDVEMPGMSGFELLELMQADSQLKGLPAILVTSRASVEDKQRGAAAGAKDYIAKGEFDQLRLLARIRELVA